MITRRGQFGHGKIPGSYTSSPQDPYAWIIPSRRYHGNKRLALVLGAGASSPMPCYVYIPQLVVNKYSLSPYRQHPLARWSWANIARWMKCTTSAHFWSCVLFFELCLPKNPEPLIARHLEGPSSLSHPSHRNAWHSVLEITLLQNTR